MVDLRFELNKIIINPKKKEKSTKKNVKYSCKICISNLPNIFTKLLIGIAHYKFQFLNISTPLLKQILIVKK